MTSSGNAIERMLQPYELASLNDRRNAAKEVIQEIVLCGLSRSGFFDKAAFCYSPCIDVLNARFTPESCAKCNLLEGI